MYRSACGSTRLLFKGVVPMKTPTCFVAFALLSGELQGLYGHFESQIFEWPTGVPRRSRLVFIGNLPPRTQEALRAGVSSCIAPPRSRRSPPPPRRLAQEAAGGGSAFAARLGSVKFGGGDDDLFV